MLKRLNVDLEGRLTPIHTTVAYWPCESRKQYHAERFPVFISYTEGDEGLDGALLLLRLPPACRCPLFPCLWSEYVRA